MPPGYTPKLLLVTKLTAILLFAAFMQVSAGTYAQKISIKETNVKITDIFKKITKQSGYYLIYNKDLIEKAPVVSIKVSNQGIREVLDKLLPGLNLAYQITDKGIAITEKKSSESFPNEQRNVFINIDVHGRVIDENGKGLAGAVIKLKDGRRTTVTNTDGEFTFFGVDENATIIISFLGFKVQEIKVSKQLGNIQLEPIAGQLNEVGVVSTGYQTIPKERATGSFTQVDNALINRSVSTNILDRLDGIASGLIFNKNRPTDLPNNSAITIRGRATLFSNPNPLVVIDNFPYDGDLNNLNPNDFESFTILKDAAAASAWGSRSGNGVIVITTKKGMLNTAPKINFNVNTVVGSKPDLMYSPSLTSSQYIEIEQMLFNKGAYNNVIGTVYRPISSAAEIFLARRNGTISSADSLLRINSLKSLDYRNHLSKYFYRNSVSQQYQLNISGGGQNQKYFVSAGYDKNMDNQVGNAYSRVTLNAANTYYFLNYRLELFTSLIYTGSKTEITSLPTLLYPYLQIADESGKAMAVPRSTSLSYAQSAGNGKLLNWLYKPLEELNNRYSSPETVQSDYRINTSLSYKILNGLRATLLYGYEKANINTDKLNELNSYYTRDLINTYTQISVGTGALVYPVPMGAILDKTYSNLQTHNGRFQTSYDHNFGKHSFNGIAGTEFRDFKTDNLSTRFYGYDPETNTNQNSGINFTTSYPSFTGGGNARIQTFSGQDYKVNRFLSYYTNVAYSYDGKYIISASARKDESNIFGVATNQKGVPLWSTGLAWNINKEKFYKITWLPELKLRMTYGYTGNVNSNLSAYLASQSTGALSRYNVPYSSITNPPNPTLRWEKNRNINLGLDFASKNNRIYGNIDFWQKKGLDLIGNSPVAPQTGVVIFTGNSANTLTKGLDLQLNSSNLIGAVKWSTTLLYNYSSSKVTDYKVSNGTNLNVVSMNYNNPLQGFPYYSIFSFKYAGLDNQGNPRGYVNGVLSSDYGAILNSTNRNDIKYNGSGTPTSFGTIRNSFEYKNIDFSFIISYRLGYYFRRYSLNVFDISSGSGYTQNTDYDYRWQRPGDEMQTNIPSILYPFNSARNDLYNYSDALIEKADNIRLQDVRVGYTFKKISKFPLKNLNIFTYLNNAGIVWRANKYHLDPDYPAGIPSIQTIAFGLRGDL